VAPVNVAGTVTCNFGTLANGGSATLTLQLQTTNTGLLTDTAIAVSDVADPNSLNNTASAAATVINPTADLALALFGSPDPVFPGATLTYTLIISNGGPSTASGVAATNTLPAGVKFLGASPLAYLTNGSLVAFTNLGNLGAYAVTNLTITVQPLALGLLSDSASVADFFFDPVKANNFATVKTLVALPLLNLAQGAPGSLNLSWAAANPNVVLESTANLASGPWAAVTNPAANLANGQWNFTAGTTNGPRFFRLHWLGP
jgi:uncharacterized repeat protein (TIGR01451 family)